MYQKLWRTVICHDIEAKKKKEKEFCLPYNFTTKFSRHIFKYSFIATGCIQISWWNKKHFSKKLYKTDGWTLQHKEDQIS